MTNKILAGHIANLLDLTVPLLGYFGAFRVARMALHPFKGNAIENAGLFVLETFIATSAAEGIHKSINNSLFIKDLKAGIKNIASEVEGNGGTKD